MLFDSLGGIKLPFLNQLCWQINCKVNAKKTQACELLSGRHNFEWLLVTQEGELCDPVCKLSMTLEGLNLSLLGVLDSMMKTANHL